MQGLNSRELPSKTMFRKDDRGHRLSKIARTYDYTILKDLSRPFNNSKELQHTPTPYSVQL